MDKQQLAYFSRLSHLFEAMPDALIMVDEKGRIVLFNQLTERLFGYEHQELVGELIEKLIPVRFQASYGAHRNLYFDTPDISRGEGLELYGLHKNGTEFPIEISISPIKTEEGSFVISTIRDITIHKHGEQAKAMLSSIVEFSDDAIIGKDMNGDIISWNKGAEKLYGYTAKEAIGKSISIILSEEKRTEMDIIFQKITHGENIKHFRTERITKDKHVIPVSITLSPIKDNKGKITGVSSTARDIADQISLEKQLRAKNEELLMQNRRVQEATRLKSEFLANMSHELRTPLNGIIGFAELMYTGKVGPVSTQHQEFLGDILTSSHHLLQLINDVLDLSKIESGKMDFYPTKVEMEKLVSEVCEILRMLMAKKRISLKVNISPDINELILDPSKFKQILYNYLSNSIKFTDEGGVVTINIFPENNREFRIEVQDTGIGIHEKDLKKLFMEFQQLDTSISKKYQGTGLGLALTRRVVEAQGGRVGVESEYGKGSTFYAILPRIANMQVSEETTSGFSSLKEVTTILVIEDDTRERELIVESLIEAGYAVQTAATGEEALYLCDKQKFDAITLDLLLPDMNGSEILEKLRNGDGPNKDVSVIVVTVVREKDACFGFTISDFLLKPVRPEQLVASIKRIGINASNAKTVLFIDDDKHTLKVALKALEDYKVNIVCETNSKKGLKLAEQLKPSVLVLDLLMPDLDGFEFLHQFKLTPTGKKTPVIIWTVKDLTLEEQARLQDSAETIIQKHGGKLDDLLAELHVYLDNLTEKSE